MEPADRRYADVADRLGKSRALICKWGSRWKWEERAAAWDNHLDQVVRKRVEKERIEMVKRHLEYARISIDIAVAHFKSIQKRIDAGEDVGLTVRDALALLDWGIKNERLCYGSPTEYLEGVIQHKAALRIRFIEVREQRRDDAGAHTQTADQIIPPSRSTATKAAATIARRRITLNGPVGASQSRSTAATAGTSRATSTRATT